MFEIVNFEALEAKWKSRATELYEALPDDNTASPKELMPILAFAEAVMIGSMTHTNVPKGKKSLGFLGGVIGCFCQHHEVPTEKNTDFLHAFFLCMYGSGDGDNLTNNFLYLHKQNDPDTTAGTLEGLDAFKQFAQDGNVEAFLPLKLMS